jgi:hypothetical protein
VTEALVRRRSLPNPAASGAASTPEPVPSGVGSTTDLAERCAAAAEEVSEGRCSTARLGAAAEVLDAALGAITRWDAYLVQVATTRDGAGDLLAALSAAGLDPADRRELEGALARLLAEAAVALRSAPH